MLIQRLFNHVKAVIILLVFFTAGNAYSADPVMQDPVNFPDIRKFASIANAAYQTETNVRELDALGNYTLSRYDSIPDVLVTYFLLTDDSAKTQIIAVRGTSNMENAIVDAAFKLTPDEHTGIYLHDGFSYAARAIYTEIKPQLKTGYSISTTGHSLGGAVALILGMYLDRDDFTVDTIITFGQPKVTNISGAKKFQHLNLIRVVTPRDVVPMVPPFDIIDINNPDIYWHSGTEIVLLADDTYAVLEGVDSMLRATRFTQVTPDENNLKNHQMSLYMEMLDKKISTARAVPYKNSFNLFNLFGSEDNDKSSKQQ